jgi:hypothetical protein
MYFQWKLRKNVSASNTQRLRSHNTCIRAIHNIMQAFSNRYIINAIITSNFRLNIVVAHGILFLSVVAQVFDAFNAVTSSNE